MGHNDTEKRTPSVQLHTTYLYLARTLQFQATAFVPPFYIGYIY